MNKNDNDILNLDLSEETSQKLIEHVENWKAEYAEILKEKNEEVVQAKLQEIDEKNEEWREGVVEEYSEKLLDAIKEMQGEVKARAVAEYVANDPSFKIFEEVKRLVAPTINEEYTKNIYLEEIVELRKKVQDFEKQKALEEGVKVREELIASYPPKVRSMLRQYIGECVEEEVEKKYWEMIEVLNEDSDEEESDDDFDLDDFEDFDFDDETEEEDEDIDWGESSSIDEDLEDEDTPRPKKKSNPLRDSILGLV